jgi:glycolate oxidase iron-sulfur subunit
MQTSIIDPIKATAAGREAEAILRSCVHCGFCTAACPTYQLTGDELDGPRGRIYLIKQVMEGAAVSDHTQRHLDRCLHCLSCETACPSGVHYGRLVDYGRELMEARVPRETSVRLLRRLLRWVLPYPRRFAALLRTGQRLRSLLPPALRTKLPPPQSAGDWPTARHARRMLVLEGCVQSVATPATNAAAARVLDRLGISLIRAAGAGWCGAMSHHLAAGDEALAFARRNIDAWWPHVEQGVEAVVVTASGCGAHIKDYGRLLRDDPRYADTAARIAALSRDLSEVLAAEDLAALEVNGGGRRIAVQTPCTLQHAQRGGGVVEAILARCGYRTTAVADAHLCCGSAGTYSLLQPALSQQLLAAKLAALQADEPALIATANVGCQLHLQSRAAVPVKHWVELLDEAGLAEQSMQAGQVPA